LAIVTWFGTCTDIHDQKLANQQLVERESEFTTLADNVAQLSWMARPDGYIYWYNKQWYDYTGTDLNQMEGQGWEKVHHPDHIKLVAEFVSQAWTKDQPWELTFPLRGADGEYRWFLTRAVPVHDEQGQLVRWLGTNTDVTEMRHLQEQLQNSYDDLEAKVTFRNLELEHELQRLRKQLGAA
jgi:PAS domain S-box-containing protein